MASTQHLIFNGQIDQRAFDVLAGALTEAIADPATSDVHIGFSSPGGDVSHGLNLYYLFRASPKPITTHALANVESIAVISFLGAATRIASPETRFLFHALGTGTLASRASTEDVRGSLAYLESDEARLVSVLRARVTLTEREARELYGRNEVRDSKWACSNGFVKLISDYAIPAGARIRSLGSTPRVSTK